MALARERAENAARLCDADGRRALFAAVDRLVGAHHMGTAFKVGLIVPLAMVCRLALAGKTYHDLNMLPPACRAINMMAGATLHPEKPRSSTDFLPPVAASAAVFTTV